MSLKAEIVESLMDNPEVETIVIREGLLLARESNGVWWSMTLPEIETSDLPFREDLKNPNYHPPSSDKPPF